MTSASPWFKDPTTLLDELRLGYQTSAPPAIPGYDDLRELKRGGQGVVYVGRQRSTKRRVAVKVLYEDAFSSEARRRRFEREIEIVAGLQHPHIVRVYDSGVTPDGRLYFVMEYVEGKSLDEHLVCAEFPALESPRDPKIPARFPAPVRSVKGVLRLFVKICDAVGHAHLHGVIHRDLKPSNIRIDPAGEPHVLDFGIARPVGSLSEASAPALTLTHHFLGTLAYASPEQLTGDPAQVDVRSDVYSIGVMLYEVLTGASPYLVSGPVSECMRAITEGQPEGPAVRRRRAIVEARAAVGDFEPLDHEAATIVTTALAKEPARRYSSAQALGHDLRRYLAGEPIDAKRDSAWYVFAKTARRYKFHAGAAASLVILLAVFGAAVSVMYGQKALEARKARQIQVFLEDTLGSVRPSRPGAPVTVREVLDEAVYFVDHTLHDQPEVEASLRTTIGNSYRMLGLFDLAKPQLDGALELRMRCLGEHNLETAQTLGQLGQWFADRGEWDRAEPFLRRALAIRRGKLGSHHMEVAYTLQNLADVVQRRDGSEEVEELLRESLSICMRVHGEEHAGTAIAQYKLGRLLHTRRRYGEAERLYRAALVTQSKLHRAQPRHPDIIRSLAGLGEVLLDEGKTSEAASLLRDNLEVRMKDLAETDGHRAELESLYADSLQRLSQYAEAEPLAQRSFENLRNAYGAEHPATVRAVESLVRLYHTLGESSKAETYRTLLSAHGTQRLP